MRNALPLPVRQATTAKFRKSVREYLAFSKKWVIFFYVCVFLQMFEHRESTQAVSLVVSWKYKEMYGRILKSIYIVNLYRGIAKLKLKINVNLQLSCCVLSFPWLQMAN